MAPILVILLRLLVPLSIIRLPFAGVLLSIAVDAADVILLDALGWGIFTGKDYHAIDKLFDTYYLVFACAASLKWRDVLARRTSVVLFLWRIAGVFAFEIAHVRQIIFFAPNIFENFYLLVTGLQKFFPQFRITTIRRLAILLVVAAVPKIAQEYIMHFKEFPTWVFIKHNVLRWR